MSELRGEALTCVRGERTVFSDLSFSVRAGGCLVLIGPNGSGKSSLLHVMAGLLRAASGRLLWDGHAISRDPAAHHARLHYLGHLDAVKPALTAREALSFWAALRGGTTRAERRAAVATALEIMGIAALADVPARYYSAGQRRRLGLARIVASPAPLWLLDEPGTALDADAVDRLDGAIARHRRKGGMVVVATHGQPDPEATEILDLSRFAVGMPW